MQRSFVMGLGLALVVCTASPAQATGAGNYTVSGTNPDGSRYSGIAVISQKGQGTWTITWQVGRSTYSGFGVGTDRIMAVAYTGTGATGVISYLANPEGGYSGIWATENGRTPGTENLRPK